MSRDEVLARGIPWDSLGGAYIDEKSVDMIKKYDKKVDNRATMIETVRSDTHSNLGTGI